MKRYNEIIVVIKRKININLVFEKNYIKSKL